MGKITSSVGLISGIDTGTIINELMQLNSQPVTLLQNRVTTTNAQKSAYSAMATQLQQLQTIGQSLQNPTTFAASTANSSDQTVLTASAGANAAVGSYSFDVASLVTSQQAISNGFNSATSTLNAGTITISQGGGEAGSQTTLAQLNGGTGVQRGQFRITDRSGNSAVIDVSKAVTLDDVVSDINNSLDVSVKASIKDDHLVLTDQTGQTKSHLIVTDVGSGQSAADLGIVGNTNSTTITGSGINTISSDTPLSLLNDGRGVGSAVGASDFQVNLSDGSNVQIALGAIETVGDVVAAINKNSGGKFTAAIDTANNAIKLTDNTGGLGNFSVAALNNSTAASDLGIIANTGGTTIRGNTLLASINSVLVKSLNGGTGLPLGTIHITDRTNASADVDLTSAKSVQDIIDDINKSGLKIQAGLNSAGDGIQLADTSNSGGNIQISDVDSTTAAALGIAGTFNTSTSVINGANLHTQYVSNNTLLKSYNGGLGVNLGSFKITNSKGATATVDLSQGTFNTIGDVIGAINGKQIGVTASINSKGDGILLTDSAGGGTLLSVSDISGTTAHDLNISGTATGTTLDGTLTKTITVTNTDTLTTLQQKIQTLGFGVSANIVNDGSGVNGYHLSLSALNSGRSGRFVFDGGTTGVSAQNVVEAQNAAVFYGGSNAGQSLLVTSSTNQLTAIVPGVTIQLQGTGNATLNVARDPSAVSNQLQTFATTFNGLQQEITTLTAWNSDTNTAGLLLGDATVQDIQQQLYAVFDSVVNGAGQFKLASDLGLSLNGDGTANFDQNKFSASYATDPTAVQNLFTQTKTGLASVLNNTMTSLIDPVTGEVTLEEKTLANQVQGFQDSINQLNAVLANQRTVLQNEFANMETVLAGLQGQQQALASIGTIGSLSTSNNKSSSSSSSNSNSSSSN